MVLRTRSDTTKEIEILLLRFNQLAVLQRRTPRPRMSRTDRAVVAALTRQAGPPPPADAVLPGAGMGGTPAPSRTTTMLRPAGWSILSLGHRELGAAEIYIGPFDPARLAPAKAAVRDDGRAPGRGVPRAATRGGRGRIWSVHVGRVFMASPTSHPGPCGTAA